LRRSELPRDSVALARFLLGTLLVRDTPDGRLVARIVETEAYVEGDAASHAFNGPTARNRTMFMRGGHAYIYLIYGTAHCLNVTSEEAGVGAAVLLRAAEPLAGLAALQRARGPAVRSRDLLRGPGRLAAAFGLDRSHDGLDLCARGASLWLAAGEPVARIGTSSRIGITRAADRQLRFFVPGSPFVSGTRLLAGFAPRT
jgi:DNA-3-methyladenine glycosylase